MADPRNIKSVEQRYDLQFNRRTNRRRRTMRAAMAICLMAPAAYLAVAIICGNQTVYWSRPVSNAHDVIKNDCSACHTRRFQPIARLVLADGAVSSVEDRACTACHSESAGDHAATMRVDDVAHCAMCHREHRGRLSLKDVADARCVRCHRELKTRSGAEPSFAARISSLADHPEFAVLRNGSDEPAPGANHQALQLAELKTIDGAPRWRDRSQLRFDHAKHLAPEGMLLPWNNTDDKADKPRKRLDCRSCHQDDGQGAYMRPVNYERHCAECHPLAFSEKLVPGGTLPHVAPELLRGVLRERLLAYARQHPDEVSADRKAPSRLPNKSAEEAVTDQDRWQWAEQQLQQRQGAVFRSVSNGCAHCHVVDASPRAAEQAPFTVAAPNVPSRWLPYSRFRHDRHDVLKCDACHSAPGSHDTGDILLPSIETCKQCHGTRGPRPISGRARSDCVECHDYHHAAADSVGRSLQQLVPDKSLPKAQRQSQ